MAFGKAYSAVIADDHAVVRGALIAALTDPASMDGYTIEIVETVENGIDAIAAIRKHRPDLVMLDVSMPHAGGTEVLIEARRWSAASKIVIFTGIQANGKIAELVETGADGVFCKADDLSVVTDSIPRILQGGRIVCERFSALLDDAAGLEPLTDRERQVLNLVVAGRSNKEIASTLGISAKTVDRHRTSVMGKTGSHSAAELIAYALREGLIGGQAD